MTLLHYRARLLCFPLSSPAFASSTPMVLAIELRGPALLVRGNLALLLVAAVGALHDAVAGGGTGAACAHHLGEEKQRAHVG